MRYSELAGRGVDLRGEAYRSGYKQAGRPEDRALDCCCVDLLAAESPEQQLLPR